MTTTIESTVSRHEVIRDWVNAFTALHGFCPYKVVFQNGFYIASQRNVVLFRTVKSGMEERIRRLGLPLEERLRTDSIEGYNQ